MDAQSGFRIIIGGGGLTGLTLANMLQLYGIDFVLLESNPGISLARHAGISLLPHGSRILDQLDLYDKVLELALPVKSLLHRDQIGKVIHNVRDVDRLMHERHGYPILSLDFQRVLQVLYDNIQDKSKILTNKEIWNVDVTHNGVVVKTSDGSLYNGDILVGADGNQSTVRDTMWQIADELSPGWISSDEHGRPSSDYGCISGRSSFCGDIEPCSRTSVCGKHYSYIINSGPDGHLYWSCFFKLEQRARGNNIPTFTEEDEREILDARSNDNITPTVKFRHLLDSKDYSTIFLLQEYVFRRWHFQRIITIGDAAHKISPISSYSESACLESAATLVNAIREALAGSNGTKPTLNQIGHAFSTAQSKLQARLITLEKHAHEQHRAESLDTLLHAITGAYSLPKINSENIIDRLSRHIPLAEMLDGQNLGQKSLLVPYKTELLRAPTAPGMSKWYFVGAYLLISGICYYGMWVQPGYYGLWDHMGKVLTTGEFPYNSGFPLKRTYIGNEFIDNIFMYLSVVFMSGLKDWDPSFRFHNVYFLGILIQPITVWAVEAFRKRNLRTPVSMVTIWCTLSQFTGMGIYMPLYYAVHSFVSESESYWWPLTREVPIQYADSMIWAVMIGYTLPTIILFIRWEDPFTLQNIEALWQLSPMLVPLLCTLFAYFHPSRRTRVAQKPQKANELFPDLEPLKRLYVVTGILGLLFHVYCVFTAYFDPELSISAVFWPDFITQEKTLGEGVKFMFLIDVWALEIATYVWSCQAVWDLKRVGRSNANILKAAALIAVSTVILGPGATLCAVWYWRETRLAKTSFAPLRVPGFLLGHRLVEDSLGQVGKTDMRI
ncbi:hypothetical protein V495_05159 [Pseudogymnoascus sp. VKM F-4514 (FW-929)]|nr:hypothetical protein V495_05159 [Pseudogymnoascus sp. VKM F-4514 (FW-929)]KFY54505.1 hypothetical protein V497_07648 [Pseudogymnoascus sp. VKM F-4516 (FW-969)]